MKANKLLKALGIGLLLLLALLLIGPFLVPVPDLQGLQPARSLADPDSQFIEIEGLEVHYKMQGQGEPLYILLHGFGSSLYSWNEVMPLFAGRGTVVAFDRPAFGLTERPLGDEIQESNPYTIDFQARLVLGMMDALGFERAVLVGNSAGGTVAAYTTLAYPQRVSGLVLVDAAIYSGGGTPAWIRPLLRLPQFDRLGLLASRSIQSQGEAFIEAAWHNPALITAQDFEAYREPLQVENWDAALWEFTRASRPSGVSDRLAELTLPVLVITGDDDRIVPTEESMRLAAELPNASLAVIGNCGHVPHEECPQAFWAAVDPFIQQGFVEEK